MDLMKANNQRLKALRGLDRLYAETLVTYMRGFWGKDSAAMEDALADLLDDMQAAAADGISAKAHFGVDPQTAADEILAQLPTASIWQWLVRLWPLFNVLCAIVLGGGAVITALGEPFTLDLAMQWSLLPLLFLPVVSLFRGLGFNHIQRKTKWRAGIGLVLAIGFYVAMFFLPATPLSDDVILWGGAGVIVSLLAFNLALLKPLPQLTKPWLVFWVLGALLMGLQELVLPQAVWVMAAVLVVGLAMAVYIHQVAKLHFVAQARGAL